MMKVLIREELVAKAIRGLPVDSYGGHQHMKHIKCVTGIYVCVKCLQKGDQKRWLSACWLACIYGVVLG